MSVLVAVGGQDERPLCVSQMAGELLPLWGLFVGLLVITALSPVWGIPVGMFAAWMYLGGSAQRGARLREQMSEALVDFHAGRFDKAHAQLLAITRRSAGLDEQEALSRFNLARVKLRLGRHAEARALLEPVIAVGWFEQDALFPHQPKALGSLALACGLDGDLEGAHWWLDVAYAKAPHLRHTLLLPATIVLLLREKRFERALTVIESQLRRAARVLSDHDVRVIKLLRRFAWSRHRNRYRREAMIPPVSDDLGCMRDLAYLWSEWPELRDFAQSLGT